MFVAKGLLGFFGVEVSGVFFRPYGAGIPEDAYPRLAAWAFIHASMSRDSCQLCSHVSSNPISFVAELASAGVPNIPSNSKSPAGPGT